MISRRAPPPRRSSPLVTSINGTPVTTQQQYIDTASQIESGQEVEMCHLDVTLDTEESNVGPYCEKFKAP